MSEKVDCPIRGKRYDCRMCHFYQKVYSTEYQCIEVAKLAHLNEIANNIRVLVESSEGQRELAVQTMRSHVKREVSPELLRLVGCEESK